MEEAARLYFCARCRRQVVICSRCDRGNQYCGEGCAQQARATSLQTAAKRYQQTQSGRHRHAARQRAYRARKKSVTHQGSAQGVVHAVVTREREVRLWMRIGSSFTSIHCHQCGGQCSVFLRRDYLRTPRSPESRVT